jgi:putative transposase
MFGTIKNGAMIVNEYGKCVQRCWDEIPSHFPQVHLDEYIVMPDHVHGIICIRESDTSGEMVDDEMVVGVQDIEPLQRINRNRYQHILPGSIGSIIRGFKIGVTKIIRKQLPAFKWQRNYYEHIIRTDHDLQSIRGYIQSNPIRWKRIRGEDNADSSS